MGTLTDRVRNHVLEAINQGKFGIGEVLPATEELADQVKCSSGTVRKALMDLANEGVLKRIQRRGTVVARKPSTGHVCLILPPDAHTNLLFQDVVHGALVNAGYEVDLVPTAMGAEAVQTHCNQLMMSASVPDCVIALEPTTPLFPIVESMAKRAEYRVIFQFDNNAVFKDTQLITVDHQRAARDVVEHLLKLGHRKISIIAGGNPNDGGWSSVAAAQCKDLLEVAGAEFIPHYLFEGGTARVIQRFLHEGVTAYWGITDHECTQIVNECYQAGLKIPQDVSIVGRHDTPWSRDCRPPLTTVSLNPEGVAAAIVEALHDQRRDPDQIQKMIKVQTRLVVRESTGPAKRK